jgi:5'-3' exonuclease
MYKYKGEGSLIENFYLMLSLFRHYQIIPIFIFDGIPPAEKKEIINMRKREREEYHLQLDNLKKDVINMSNESDKKEAEVKMSVLVKKVITITSEDIKNIKTLMNGFGVSFYQAKREADEVCAYLVLTGRVYACLSEDNDMFVYGCPRILRYLSLVHQNIILYDFQKILSELVFTQEDFTSMCICSGTDYNMKDVEIDIYQVYEDFHKMKENESNCLVEIKNKYFNPFTKNYLKLCDDIIISNKQQKIAYDLMIDVLVEDGFVF